MRCWTLFVLAGALTAQTQTGEVTTREETPTFQSSVNLVRVPVVVRDKQGHAVGGLQKQDFQLTDRGKPQYVSQFAIEGSAVAPQVPVGAGHARPAVPITEVTGEPAAEGSKLVVPTHFVALVFDDVHLKLEDLAAARIAASKYLEHGIPPQARVGLFTLSGNVSLEFTNDLAKIREALLKIMPASPPPPCEPTFVAYLADQWVSRGDGSALGTQANVTADCLDLQGPARAAAPGIARATLHEAASLGRSEAISSLRALKNTVRLLAGMAGDRIMILVSPGMYLPDELQKDLSESIELATRSGVIINTLDARGVYTVDPTGDADRLHLKSLGVIATVLQYDNLASLAQGIVLEDLAHGTGGAALSQNDFLAEFDRLSNPPEHVYYLGFYPKELKPDGKYHEIKVTLTNGKGMSVQARKGYWAPSHEEDAATTASREIGEAVFSRDEVRDLPIDIHTEFFKTTADDATLTVNAHLDIRQLPLRKQDDRSRDDLTLVCALFDGNGNYVKGTQKVVELRVKDENLEQRLTRGVTVSSDFDVKSGPYMIRVVLRDAEGRQMATANGVAEIP